MAAMRSCLVLVALLTAGPVSGLSAEVGTEDVSVAAVQKVIQMLGDMSAKCKEEKKNEEIAMAEFGVWCTSEQATLEKNIEQAAEEIELLTASIEKLTVEAKVLGEEIKKLQSDVASYEAEKKAKTIQRAKDHAAFVAEAADYGESLDALDRAIQVLMARSADGVADSKNAASADTVLLQLAGGQVACTGKGYGCFIPWHVRR